MPVFYKYLPVDRKSYLSDALLRFTPPSALNDPYECLPGVTDEYESEGAEQFNDSFSGVKTLLNHLTLNGLDRKERRKVIRIREKEVKKIVRENSTTINDFFLKHVRAKVNIITGILSLSKRWDSSLMWSHYADSHHGFCVGFKEDHEWFSDYLLGPVKYLKNRPLLKSNSSEAENFAYYYIKSQDWEYEQEVRVISTLDKAARIVASDPYDISLFEVPHEAISEIILGLHCTEDLLLLAKQLSESYNIAIYKTMLSKQSFDLNRVLISA